MGIISSIKVVRLALGLCLLLVPESSPSLCPHRRQYWHEVKERCVNCTKCHAGQIVMRPCQVHRDAQCGPISDLNIDWSFLTRTAHRQRAWDRASQDSDVKRSRLHSPHQHQHNHHSNHERNLLDHKSHHTKSKALHSHNAHQVTKQERLEIARDFDPVDVVDASRVVGESRVQLPESAALRRVAASGTVVPPHEVKTPVAPFSAVEELVWDWQVVVLVLAVFACLLFFLVTGIYSIYHARQWRRLKVNFDSDVEEAYARRSLMVPGLVEPRAVHTPLDPYASRQGLCMEQLLVRKKQQDVGTEKGNFYIVRDKSKLSRGN